LEKGINYLNDYLEYLRYQKNYSMHTIKSYQTDILEYLEYLATECIQCLKVNYEDLRFYLTYLKDKKENSNTSINRKLSALRGFYKFLVNSDLMSFARCLIYQIPVQLSVKEMHFY